jgi:hypothetical protein
MQGLLEPARATAVALLIALVAPCGGAQAGGAQLHAPLSAPQQEGFNYTVEWRLINAGIVKFRVAPSGTPDYPSLHSELDLESTGLVAKLYKVQNKYFGNYDRGFCAISAQISTSEGRRRRETHIDFDRARNVAIYNEKDLAKNTVIRASEAEVPHCVHDVVGALLKLRTMRIDVGKSAELPLSDGKKSSMVRVEAQERETVTINGTTHSAVRYEAFLFNNVIYSRDARLFVWMTDDARKLPVQIRIRMGFPVGTVTLTLDKIEQS